MSSKKNPFRTDERTARIREELFAKLLTHFHDEHLTSRYFEYTSRYYTPLVFKLLTYITKRYTGNCQRANQGFLQQKEFSRTFEILDILKKLFCI